MEPEICLYLNRPEDWLIVVDDLCRLSQEITFAVLGLSLLSLQITFADSHHHPVFVVEKKEMPGILKEPIGCPHGKGRQE